jgi:hypothetical protein
MSDRRSSEHAARQCDAALGLSPVNARSKNEDKERLARLVRTIEGEIVPRLLVSLSSSLTEGHGTIEQHEVALLARLLLMREDSGAAAAARIIHPPGTARHKVCLGLIAPVAQRLSELWERGECDFGQLFLGLNRLEALVRGIDSQPPSDPRGC